MTSLPDEARVWLEKARIATVPKLRQCENYLGLVTEDFINDPVCLLQIGAALVLGKPLYLVVVKGTKLPGKLIDVIDGLVEIEGPDDPTAQMKIQSMLKNAHKNT